MSEKIYAKCVNDSDCNFCLTVGKTYEVSEHGAKNFWHMVDDRNNHGSFYKERFEIVDAPTEPDPVNHPEHYQIGGVETYDIIKSMLTADELQGYLKGTVLKYRLRAEHKGNAETDYGKAKWFYDKLMEGEE